MSLDISLPLQSGEKWPPEHSVSLNDDGYYWFMCPAFEALAAKTGQMLDLYDGATFSGDAIEALRATVAGIRREVLNQPTNWKVHTGSSIGSYLHPTPPQPICQPVNRETFLSILDSFDELIGAALRLKLPIIARGD